MSDFHLLLEDQIPRLMRYALALTRNSEQAGDLVEDTLREGSAREQDWRSGTELHTWLLTILHEQRDNPFRRAIPAARDYTPAAAARLGMSAFDRALGRLPEEQRAAILLIGLEGLSYNETAAVLGISVGIMRARLSRGRESLRRALDTVRAPRVAHAA